MQRGHNETKIVIQCLRDGQPVPDKIANAPELWVGLEIFFVAFWELSSCRPGGMDIMEIPWLATEFYCQANGIEGELREDMHYYIRGMDVAFLRHIKGKRDG